MIKSIVRFLFGPPPPRREPFDDPVLGVLKPEETDWSVSLSRGGDSFTFYIGGSQVPDPAILNHAHDILNCYESFKQSVWECVTAESHNFPKDVKAEIAGLSIDIISLDRPTSGMIFFRGSEDDVGCWRCDYVNGVPTGLGCDT